MNLLIFIAGLLIGCGLTYFLLKNSDKNQKKSQNEAEEQMKLIFENVANKILKENTQDFSTMSKERMTELLEPFKERIEDFKKRFEQNNEKFTTLDVHIKSVIEAGNKINQDTNKLSQALKGDNMKQGKWGELILERVLELSGLKKGEEYLTQAGIGSQRPDATILLPENKAIFVDAKTTLASYDAYINAETIDEQEYYLKQFKDSVKTHIMGLSKKEYFATTDYYSPEYVLMFIPIESCYSMLFLEDAQLWEFAWKNKIMPTSPSTLLAALKIINSFHVVTRQNNNAIEIATLAGKMIDKFADMIKDLNSAQKSINNIYTKLTGRDNIVRQIERLQDLGAKANKQIPEISENNNQLNI
ncbi:MAG: DNA recombination protein RmuC [Candidatus Gastranaerophilales bacterium]|nr:DNA recombination protein RmuC [Candidatus Gastranaerophilales bacterium]